MNAALVDKIVQPCFTRDTCSSLSANVREKPPPLDLWRHLSQGLQRRHRRLRAFDDAGSVSPIRPIACPPGDHSLSPPDQPNTLPEGQTWQERSKEISSLRRCEFWIFWKMARVPTNPEARLPPEPRFSNGPRLGGSLALPSNQRQRAIEFSFRASKPPRRATDAPRLGPSRAARHLRRDRRLCRAQRSRSIRGHLSGLRIILANKPPARWIATPASLQSLVINAFDFSANGQVSSSP